MIQQQLDDHQSPLRFADFVLSSPLRLPSPLPELYLRPAHSAPPHGLCPLLPSQIFYPFTMYVKAHSPVPWVRNLMNVTSLFILAVSVLATMGSFYALATAS